MEIQVTNLVESNEDGTPTNTLEIKSQPKILNPKYRFLFKNIELKYLI